MILTPHRVLIKDNNGTEGVTARVAFEKYNVTPEIIFIRKDGWSLGCEKELEEEAFLTWKESWTHFIRKDGPIQPMKEYVVCAQD